MTTVCVAEIVFYSTWSQSSKWTKSGATISVSGYDNWCAFAKQSKPFEPTSPSFALWVRRMDAATRPNFRADGEEAAGGQFNWISTDFSTNFLILQGVPNYYKNSVEKYVEIQLNWPPVRPRPSVAWVRVHAELLRRREIITCRLGPSVRRFCDR